ncbi:MAG: hypothetical protein U0936_11490 [Planctomycetaceae bacterium]
MNQQIIIAAGAVCPFSSRKTRWLGLSEVKLAIDLNAVPPAGLADVGVMDKAIEKHGTICYGALGVGGLKMKVHKRAVASLFESNTAVLETRALYELALNVAGISA